jgi:transposase
MEKKRKQKPMGAIEKEAIVQEYLAGTMSYRELEVKYGYHYTNIGGWVRASLGKDKLKKPMKHTVKELIVPPETGFSEEIRQLQIELRRTQLQNKLLNTMIDIAETQLKINIRKKSGTKR